MSGTGPVATRPCARRPLLWLIRKGRSTVALRPLSPSEVHVAPQVGFKDLKDTMRR